MKRVVIIPLYNEARYIGEILEELRNWYCGDILVVNDGSTDESAQIIAGMGQECLKIHLLTHPENRGYGASLISGFKFAQDHGYEALVTMDCDWQHEPHYVPAFFEMLTDPEKGADIISGSRYLRDDERDTAAPADRKAINGTITQELNALTGYRLTDSFCGFKAIKVASLAPLSLDEHGYAFPLQFWIQAQHFGLTVRELAVPRIYLDPTRNFGAELSSPERRLAHYREVIKNEVARWNK